MHKNGIDHAKAKKSGLMSLGLSLLSIVLILGMRLMPGAAFLTLIVVLISAIACSIEAALRGSKLWLLASVWPVLYGLGLLLSIFGGE